ncbi:MAG: BlaI/MecI/CopY family transcriptional regulator [Eubacteriales bacterium]
MRKEVCLTQSEWYVMDCLWAYAPQTVMQLATDLSQRAGWAKSTTITTLERMEAKGLIRSTPVGRDTQYHPCVRREEAAKSEVCSFLDRIYRWSVGLMVSTIAEGRQAIQQRVARLGKRDRPQKSRSGRSGGAPDTGGGARLRGRSPPPHTATPGMRRPWRTLGPSISQRRQSPARGIPHRGGGCPGGGPVAPAPGGRV